MVREEYAGEAESGKREDWGQNCGRGSVFRNAGEGNPFRNGEGIEKFKELYTGKRRTDRTAWADYFLSGVFLKGYREEAFTKLLWEVVESCQADYPPSKEFLTELYIAYGLRKSGDQFEARENAVFTGISYIVDIASLGPAIRSFKKNDPAMQAAFDDYRELLVLSQDETWGDDQTLRLGKIVDRYLLSNISDRPLLNARQYELSQRHPKALRLITYFFRYTKLPDKVYRTLWNHLRLDTATNGREKLLYGGLREAALSRLPELQEKPRVSYRELLRDFNQYGTGTSYFFNNGETEEERERMDRFFEREDLNCALTDESFAEEQLLKYWITRGSGSYLLLKLKDYYQNHPEAPFSEKILLKIEQVEKEQTEEARRKGELSEDEQSEFTWGKFDFQKRAYVRYYLNTAFHLPKGIQKPICLEAYLARQMPYSPDWSRKLTDPEVSGLDPGHPVELWFQDQVLSITFHQRYLEYRWNGSPKVPYYPGEDLAEIKDDTEFWLLAPIAAAPYGAHLAIYRELMKRLLRLPVHEEDIPVIADCITGGICRLDQENFPAYRLYREKGDQLYVCEVYQSRILMLYEESGYERKPLPGGNYTARDLDQAVRMGLRLLNELTREEDDLTLSMELLPEQVLARRPCHPEEVIAGEDVTADVVQKLLTEYFDHKIHRLELAYGGHSLLLIKEGGTMAKYGCFYFNHASQDWYGLVSMPEVYREVSIEDVVHVPFGLGTLPNYLVHQNLFYIREQLEEILLQIACYRPNPQSMMWAPQIYRFEMRQRYRLAKRLYGGYPAEQARNQIADRFYLPHLPVRMSWGELDGTASKMVEVGKNKAEVQRQLSRFMWGQLGRLSLIWQYEAGEAILYRYLVLLKDGETYQMIYMDDDRSYMSYLVYDVREYLDADGKKCRKERFLGEKMPGYLVHRDLQRIRDTLDLLLCEIQSPSAVIGRFGEFAYEGEKGYRQVKERYL